MKWLEIRHSHTVESLLVSQTRHPPGDRHHPTWHRGHISRIDNRSVPPNAGEFYVVSLRSRMSALYLLKAFETQFCGTNLTFIIPMPNSKSLAILRVSWWSFPRAHTRMPPKGRSWKELTWSWAYSTGHPASDQKLEAAAHAAWSYAYLLRMLPRCAGAHVRRSAHEA